MTDELHPKNRNKLYFTRQDSVNIQDMCIDELTFNSRRAESGRITGLNERE